MKIYSDSLQDKIDEYEKSKVGYKEKIKSLSEQLKKSAASSDKHDKRDQEIQSLKLEILQNNQILKSYEENNLKMTELEKKLRMQNSKHEKDLKAIEEKYMDKIKSLQKKVLQYEDIIKNTNKLPETNNYATKYSHRGGETERLTVLIY
jgi:predicted RNase H-like nuclease (RuvC/YqgF family)